MRKLRILIAVMAGSSFVLGSCVTSQQLTEFGTSQFVLAVSSLVGQLVTTAIQGQSQG